MATGRYDPPDPPFDLAVATTAVVAQGGRVKWVSDRDGSWTHAVVHAPSGTLSQRAKRAFASILRTHQRPGAVFLWMPSPMIGFPRPVLVLDRDPEKTLKGDTYGYWQGEIEGLFVRACRNDTPDNRRYVAAVRRVLRDASSYRAFERLTKPQIRRLLPAVFNAYIH
jgi:hypothetical protein